MGEAGEIYCIPKDFCAYNITINLIEIERLSSLICLKRRMESLHLREIFQQKSSWEFNQGNFTKVSFFISFKIGKRRLVIYLYLTLRRLETDNRSRQLIQLFPLQNNQLRNIISTQVIFAVERRYLESNRKTKNNQYIIKQSLVQGSLKNYFLNL